MSDLLTLPLEAVSENNARENWGKRHRRRKGQRKITSACLRLHRWPAVPLPATIRLVRVAPRALDSDNLAGSLKAVRDAVAQAYGCDDSPQSGLTWEYDQRRGDPKEYAVEVGARPTPTITAADAIGWLEQHEANVRVRGGSTAVTWLHPTTGIQHAVEGSGLLDAVVRARTPRIVGAAEPTASRSTQKV